MKKVVQTAPDVSEARSPEKPQPSAADGLNIENIKLVRDYIAALPDERLNMHIYIGRRRSSQQPNVASEIVHDCGTCGCIAGWAAALLAPDWNRKEIERGAASLFGLSYEEGEDLFCPGSVENWRDITPSVAARVLDRLAKTGAVNWSAALDDGEADGPSSATASAVGTQKAPSA